MLVRSFMRAVALTAIVAGIASAQGSPPPKKSDAKAPPAAQTTKPAASPVLDINTATKAELMALPGIGEAISDKIIKARPFKGKDELVEKKILTKAAYDKIKDRIIAKQAK
ncbi:MAG TPA: helix-hairpin-helix domain-containing protein [Gemmatimonadaceae bacterium]|nr:helix-hairpin-helix domain-containing protein [Gemmatimonadaceae bacterium]